MSLSFFSRFTRHPFPSLVFAVVVLACFASLPAVARTDVGKPAPPSHAPQALANLKYRSIGPAAGGRVARVSGVPGKPGIYYAAAASGGVWKSTDGGYTWAAVSDEYPIASTGAIAVAPSDSNVIYVGAGEANIRGNVAPGNGIFKSLDGGKTWTHVWQQEGQIGTIVVHPANADLAYAAVLGHAFGPNPERGVYRTRDGGRTWQQVLKKDADTGASAVALDPTNPNIVFAGLWQARRQPWSLTSGGPGSGLYVSRDGGDSWSALTGNGLPAPPWGKVGVAVAPSDGRRVYALIEATDGGLFRSDDGGSTWTRANPHHALRQRAWYYSTLTVNPANPNEVWFPQVAMYRTIDGGTTILPVRMRGGGWDHHDLWIDPLDPRRMIGGNDAGVIISDDGGETWRAPHLPLGQVYHVAVDSRVPFRVAGTMQDLGTAHGPSNSLVEGGIGVADWYPVGGGEAGHIVSDPADPEVVYAGEYLGYISRYDHRTGQVQNISAWPDNPSGWAAAQMRYRFQWTAPIATSPHDPAVLYHAAQVLFRSTDGGRSWTAISPDLTRNDPGRQQWSGGPITGDNTGAETYCTIFAIAESPLEKGVIWAGSDDGLVHVTRDNGQSWSNVTPAMRGIPDWGTVTAIEPSRFDAGTTYVVVDAHRLDDMRPYLFKTTDYGRSWTRLDTTLPPSVYLHVVREDTTRKELLYVGTERGVRFSTDGGTTWQPLQLNMPTVAVHDLAVKDGSLVVATHGRSIWILDDLVPVRQLTPAVEQSSLFLFPAVDAVGWRLGSALRRPIAGANPPNGALVYYFLKQDAEGEVTLDVLDERGQQVRRLTSVLKPRDGSAEFEDIEQEPRKPDLATTAGVQRAVWDLRVEGARKIKNAKLDSGAPEHGPLVVPGTYTLRLTAGGETTTAKVRVLPDPRVHVSDADRAAQYTFVVAVRDDVSRVTDMVNGLRSVREQLQARRSVLGSGPGTNPDTFRQAADALIARIDALEARLHNPKAEIVYDVLAQKGGAQLYSRLSPLMTWASDFDGAPTQGMRDAYAGMKQALDACVAEYQRIMGTEVDNVNRIARELGLPYIAKE